MSTKSQAPVSAASLQDQINLCRRPFTAAAVKWKIQTNPKEGKTQATVVAFIDARLAGERLNAAGINWSQEYSVVSGGLLCTISVVDPVTGLTIARRGDVGWSKGTNDNMTLKTLYSDAFKRAAVHYGVGVSIYALPMKKLDAAKDEIKKLGNSWVITFKGKDALTKHYEDWLKEHGIPAFGEPLDHGDRLGSQGDIESTDRENDEDVAGAAPAAAAPKPAESPAQEEAPAEEAKQEGLNATQIARLLKLAIEGPKGVEDIKMFLVSKGVEDLDDWDNKSLEEAFGGLPKDIGGELFAWLKLEKKKAAGADE